MNPGVSNQVKNCGKEGQKGGGDYVPRGEGVIEETTGLTSLLGLQPPTQEDVKKKPVCMPEL